MLARPSSAAAGRLAPPGRSGVTLKGAPSGVASVERGAERGKLWQRRKRWLPWLAAAALGPLAGCTPSIGDKCQLSTDCSISGDRLCDTAQPGGYCTIFNCLANSCPDHAACVLFHANVQGCAYDDRAFGRTAHSYCEASCSSDSDCRSGYVCRDPRLPPWNAKIVDDDQSPHICIVPADSATGNAVPEAGIAAEPAVCQDTRVDASTLFSPIDGAAPEASPEDTGLPLDASSEAGPNGADASADGPSEGASTVDAGAAADAADATTTD